MPLTMPATNVNTDTCDQARPPGTQAQAPVLLGQAVPTARTPLRDRPQNALPAADCLKSGGNDRPETHASCLRRVADLLRRVAKTGGSYNDPVFERPAQVEDDYRRFRNQPYGW
jgi:hypothetical protein